MALSLLLTARFSLLVIVPNGHKRLIGSLATWPTTKTNDANIPRCLPQPLPLPLSLSVSVAVDVFTTAAFAASVAAAT